LHRRREPGVGLGELCEGHFGINPPSLELTPQLFSITSLLALAINSFYQLPSAILCGLNALKLPYRPREFIRCYVDQKGNDERIIEYFS
jgi:hypothetical protein